MKGKRGSGGDDLDGALATGFIFIIIIIFIVGGVIYGSLTQDKPKGNHKHHHTQQEHSHEK